MTITLTTKGFPELQRSFSNLRSSQMPFAAALALTATAKAVKAAEVVEVQQVFDRPTPITLNAFAVVPATKAKLVAEVGTKGLAGQRHYLPVEAKGGPRPAVGFEAALRRASPVDFTAAVPARAAKRDSYGNWSAGERNRVLAALQQQGPLQASGRMRSGRSAEYYIGRRGDTVGVWRSQGENDDLILLFVNKAPVYRKRFDFYGVAERVARERIGPEFAAALARALATAR